MKRFSEMEEQGESYTTVDSETSESDSDDEVFHEEELVVISSTDKINMLQWSEHLEENWDRLIKESTRLLVLAGVHGREDGELGGNETKGMATLWKTLRDNWGACGGSSKTTSKGGTSSLL